MSNTYDTYPTDFVPVPFRMDPETMTLLPGSKLREGMRVLVESAFTREPLTEEQWESAHYLAKQRSIESNRWCTVKDLERDSRSYDIIRFTGVYDDGHEASRTYNQSFRWYVMKDSMDALAEWEKDLLAGGCNSLLDLYSMGVRAYTNDDKVTSEEIAVLRNARDFISARFGYTAEQMDEIGLV